MKFHPASFFSSFSRTSFKNSDRYRLVLLVLVLIAVAVSLFLLGLRGPTVADIDEHPADRRW